MSNSLGEDGGEQKPKPKEQKFAQSDQRVYMTGLTR